MKKVTSIAIVLMLLSFGIHAFKLTEEDRNKAIDHLTQTRDNMLLTLDGLSEAQLNYKSSPESWSIAECVEHLAISENTIFGMVNGAVQVTADASRRAEVQMSDEELLALITDRSNKVKTSEPFEPSGQFGSFEETLKVFTSKREENINYVRITEDDLRNHYSQVPFGTVDAYQVLLFMSGHTERHTLQMEEVMADPGFPEE